MISSVTVPRYSCRLHWQLWDNAGVCKWYRFDLLCSVNSDTTENKVLAFDKEAFHKKGPKLLMILIIWLMREGKTGRHTPLPIESKESKWRSGRDHLRAHHPLEMAEKNLWAGSVDHQGLARQRSVTPHLPNFLCQRPASNTRNKDLSHPSALSC